MHKHNATNVYIIFAFLSSFAFTLAFTVNMVYLVLVMKLDPLPMILVGTALELSAFLFEVPTGVVADLYSRRLSVIIGVVLVGISFLVFVIPVFSVILFSQVILGLGWTFISGANNAWLADEIGEEAAANAYLRSAQVGQLTSVIGIPISVGLALVDLRLPIVLAGLSFILLGGYLFAFMPETGFTPTSKENRVLFQSMRDMTQAGVQTIRGKPVLMTLMVVFFVWGAFSEGYDRLWTLHILDNFHLPQLGELDVVIWFGIIGMAGIPIKLLVTEYVRRRVSMNDPIAIARILLRASGGLIAALLVFTWASSFWVALIALWLIGAMRELMHPLTQAWMNQGLNSKVRATVLSMSGQMDAIGQIAGGPGIGLIGQQFGVRAALALGAVILTPIIGLYGHTIRQNGRIVPEEASP